MTYDKWDLRFLKLAKEISTWSKDPSSTIGALIVRDKRILSTGYNGFPSGISDDNRLNDRPQKYAIIIHAEMNALMNALKHGVSVENSTLYVYGLPCCSNCAKHIIQSGIKRVVFSYESIRENWIEEFDKSSALLFEEANIEVNILRDLS